MSYLSAKASSNFDKYLDAFIKDGVAYMLPASRLTDAQWGELNAELASRGVRLVPVERDGKKFMQFSAAPRTQNRVAQFDAGAKRVGVNVASNLKRYTGYEWEHKVTSGLGFEHYRLDIGGMGDDEIERIKSELKKRAIYANVSYTNKGVFLIYNIDAVRNRPSAEYDAVAHIILDGVYNNTGVVMSTDLSRRISEVLRTSVPPHGVAAMHPDMVAYTTRMVDKYGALGALSRDGIDRLVRDFRRTLMAEFMNMPHISNGIVNWAALSRDKKLDLIKDMNYAIGSIRREHSGRTIINMGPDYYAGGGFNDSGDNVFSYKTADLDDFNRVLGLLVHENFHAFQSAGTSSVVPEIGNYIHRILTGDDHNEYLNDIKEVESRYMQYNVAKNFSNDFVAMRIASERAGRMI